MSGRGDLPYPVGYLPCPIAQLVNRIVHPPRPLGYEYGQLAVFADEQVVRETAVKLPAGVHESVLYLFWAHHRSPPSLASRVAVNLWRQRSDTTLNQKIKQEKGR